MKHSQDHSWLVDNGRGRSQEEKSSIAMEPPTSGTGLQSLQGHLLRKYSSSNVQPHVSDILTKFNIKTYLISPRSPDRLLPAP